MGFNSTLIIMNDQLERIENDTFFGKKVGLAVKQFDGYTSRKPVNIGSSASLVDCHHADFTKLIAVGGNRGIVLDTHLMMDPLTEDARQYNVHLLRNVAAQYGYRLVKKSNG